MNYNEMLLILLLIITFILLIFHFFINICDLSIKEPFNVDTYEVGGKKCIIEVNEPFPPAPEANTSLNSLSLKYNEYDYNYHTEYTCDNIIGSTTDNKYNVANEGENNYTSEISNNKLLLHYKCIKKSPKEVYDYLTGNNGGGIYTSSNLIFIDTETCRIGNDSNSLDNIIINKLNGDLNNQKKGPIYVFVAQANLLRNISAQKEFMTKGLYTNHYDGCTYDTEFCNKIKAKCQILIVYTNGEKNKINKLISYITENTSKDNSLCNIVCHNHSNENSLCGCLEMDSYTTIGDKRINPKCIVINNNGVEHSSFSMVYFVNPHNNSNVRINPWNW